MKKRITLMVVILLVWCACGGAHQSAFQQEVQSVQKTLSGFGQLSRSGEVEQDGNALECSWAYEFPGSTEEAIQAVGANIPEGYNLLRPTASELILSKFDGHDTYQAVFSFRASDSQHPPSTNISVLLKGFPD